MVKARHVSGDDDEFQSGLDAALTEIQRDEHGFVISITHAAAWIDSDGFSDESRVEYSVVILYRVIA